MDMDAEKLWLEQTQERLTNWVPKIKQMDSGSLEKAVVLQAYKKTKEEYKQRSMAYNAEVDRLNNPRGWLIFRALKWGSVLFVVGFLLCMAFAPRPAVTFNPASECTMRHPTRAGKPANPDRDFDIVLYGATGFTGKLILQYLAERHGQVKWPGEDSHSARYAIAGRSLEKLHALADNITVGPRPVVIAADAKDTEALTKLAQRTKVVITAAGPYSLYGKHNIVLTPHTLPSDAVCSGRQLVEACALSGTHYADLSGEYFFQRDMVQHYHKVARSSGAAIIVAAGFDSVPFDIGE